MHSYKYNFFCAILTPEKNSRRLIWRINSGIDLYRLDKINLNIINMVFKIMDDADIDTSTWVFEDFKSIDILNYKEIFDNVNAKTDVFEIGFYPYSRINIYDNLQNDIISSQLKLKITDSIYNHLLQHNLNPAFIAEIQQKDSSNQISAWNNYLTEYLPMIKSLYEKHELGAQILSPNLNSEKKIL